MANPVVTVEGKRKIQEPGTTLDNLRTRYGSTAYLVLENNQDREYLNPNYVLEADTVYVLLKPQLDSGTNSLVVYRFLLRHPPPPPAKINFPRLNHLLGQN